MSEQHEALRLANELEALNKGMLTSMWARDGDKKVVAELRRQHARIEADEALMKDALSALEWVVDQAGGPVCEHDAAVCFCKENAAITALRSRLETK